MLNAPLPTYRPTRTLWILARFQVSFVRKPDARVVLCCLDDDILVILAVVGAGMPMASVIEPEVFDPVSRWGALLMESSTDGGLDFRRSMFLIRLYHHRASDNGKSR